MIDIFKDHLMKKLILVLVLLCMFLAGCQSPSSLPTTGEYRPGLGRFDRAMIRLMEDWDMPGGTLAVLKDGEVLLSRGYGYAGWENGEARPAGGALPGCQHLEIDHGSGGTQAGGREASWNSIRPPFNCWRSSCRQTLRRMLGLG